MKHTQRVAYIPSTHQFQTLDSQSRHSIRSSLVHSLISTTKLDAFCNIYKLRPATLSEALLAHNSYYLALLHAASSHHHPHPQHLDLQHIRLTDDLLEQAGLVDDCAPFPGVWLLAMLTVGGAVLAATAILNSHATIACWFDGGRHHAAADSAHGFCYRTISSIFYSSIFFIPQSTDHPCASNPVNDAVVACKLLLSSSRFSNLVYIDIDVHHADGVEQAFLYNRSVTTLSFHLSEPGFFPNTPPTLFPARKPMRTHALRVPLSRGITDDAYIEIFKHITDTVFQSRHPDAIVLQCGADALAGDPLGGFNLTQLAYVQAVEHLLGKQIPILILGGGGYSPPNAARVWTDVLECCVAWTTRERAENFVYTNREIPITDDFFDRYAPSFRRDVKSLQMKDENDPNNLRNMVERIRRELGDVATG